MNDLEKKIVGSVQASIPLTQRPYREIARAIGMAEAGLLEKLQTLCDDGIIRRFGATLRHQRSGYSANAMAAWQVDEERIEAVGRTLASFKAVSHCYRRNPTHQWPYNLYTMIHAKNEAECLDTAREMAQTAEIETYRLLFSRKELKKTSMVYFPTDDID
ncbi:MAG: Lrp/AsnC family transcriptional regulator [Deltaproteobacteria bacterium]|nr:Lrp/AsnC family transcriptional regulator [Deltaproteobacteria bacterium]